MADQYFKGLRESELAKLGACAVCGKPQLGADVTFYTVTISRGGFDARAIQRRAGLQMVLGGNAVLAHAMGPDEPLAKVFDGPHELFVHEQCAHDISSLLLLIPQDDDAVPSSGAA